MSRKAVFLDKDGTLIEDLPYNVDCDRITFAPGATQALHQLHQAGYLLVVITNQSGVARGFFPESAVRSVEQWLRQQLAEIGVPLAGFYYCPHHPDGVVEPYAIACDCRKPQPGLLRSAAQNLDIDLTQSWFIGDILNDVEAGRAADCRTILINNGNETEWELSPSRLPHHMVCNLSEAAEIILSLDRSIASPLPTSKASLSHFIDAWQSLTVLVIGDVMLDCYLHGTSERLCQEAPVPVVAIAERQDVPGGAANVAANVRRLGAKPLLLSLVGQDEGYDRLRLALETCEVATDYLISTSQRSTLMKQRVVANSHLLLRFDQGSTETLPSELEERAIKQLYRLFPMCDAVIISDYGYGVLTPQMINALENLQKIYQRPMVIDSKHLDAYQSVGATAVKPNYQETVQLLGLQKRSTDRIEQILPYINTLLERTGAAHVAVTLDREGVLMIAPDQPPYHLPTTPAPTHHTSGAGDTFISTLALALAAKAPIALATQLAAAATAIVVTQPGTTACPASELRQALEGKEKGGG